MNIKTKEYLSLLIWIGSLIVIGSCLGILTKSGVDSWYITLDRSPLTPPNYIFGIAWTILYAMIATSGWIIWRSNQFAELNSIKNLYIFQLILNWSWTPLFFTYHLKGISLLCLSAIIALVALIIFKSYKKIRNAGLILIPYLLWLLFAAHLNFYIWQYN